MPLLWLSLAFLAGVITASLVPLGSPVWVGGSFLAIAFNLTYAATQRMPRLAAFSFAFPYRLPYNPIPYPVLILALVLGGLRYSSAIPKDAPGFTGFHARAGDTVIAEGMVARPPTRNDRYTSVEVKVEALVINGEVVQPVTGHLLATLVSSRRIEYGDQVRLEGRLELPAENEDFSYRAYLAGRGIYAVMPFPKLDVLAYDQGSRAMDAVYRLRHKGVEILHRLYPDPEASLLAGILLGVEEGIPADVEDAFRTTGTSHIIVISGFNISVIAGLMFALFDALFRRWWGTILTIIGIGLYTVLVGGEAPVVRAAIMGCLAIVGRQIGRSGNAFNSLFFTAAVMTAIHPSILSQVSFQLSFLATLGMMLYADPWAEKLKALLATRLPSGAAMNLTRFASDAVLVTLAAQVLTLPVILYHFGRLSLVSLAANGLILPVQPQVMALAGVSVLAGMVYLPAGALLKWAAWPFAAYTIRTVEALAKLPWADVPTGPIAPAWLVVFFAAVLFWTFLPARFLALVKKISPVVPLAGLGIAALYTWGLAFSAADGKLHITVFDASSQGIDGQALLIETPGGRRMLIGGGPSARQLSDQLGRRFQFRNELDWLVIPVAGKGRLDGLVDIMERYPPEQALWCGEMDATAAARRLSETLLDAETNVVYAQAGQALDLGEGAWLRVITCSEDGATLLLEWGDFRLFLPATAGELPPDGWATAVMLAATGEPDGEWLEQVRPQAVLAAGSPHDPLLYTSYNLLATNWYGWIEITTDGEKMWVEVEKR